MPNRRKFVKTLGTLWTAALYSADSHPNTERKIPSQSEDIVDGRGLGRG